MRMRMMLPTAALTLLCGAQAFADPIVVACRPGEHAIVRNALVGGERVTRVQCASNGSGYRTAAYRTQSETPRRARRSWGKSALIIGGSAGTGAGIGGMLKGKKGALVGAALGGGVGSLYEGAKRR